MSVMQCDECASCVDTDCEDGYDVVGLFYCEHCVMNRCNDPMDTIYQCDRCAGFFDWNETPCSKVEDILCADCLAEYADGMRDYVQMGAL